MIRRLGNLNLLTIEKIIVRNIFIGLTYQNKNSTPVNNVRDLGVPFCFGCESYFYFFEWFLISSVFFLFIYQKKQ